MARRSTASQGSNANKSSAGKPGAGCLIWLVLLIAVLILFVVKWDAIRKTLESTRFIEAVSTTDGRDGEPVTGDGSAEPADPPKPAPVEPAKPTPAPATSAPAPAPVVQPVEAQPVTPAPTTAPTTTPKPVAPAPKPAAPAATSPATSTTPAEQVRQTRIATLYFIRVEDDGTISRHEVKRTVPASDSPMSDALAALLQGPNADEISRSLVSLIPAGTRLISAQVRGSTAYLNFSEDFMYNKYGIEGYAGQLKQVVYTATGYSTVKDVQILIEGQTRDYLGGEGVYIGKPLSRSSF